MPGRTSAFFLAAVMLPASAYAEVKTLVASEVVQLLSGNTAVGEWSGTPYRQYFDPSGSTTYKPEGGREDRGRWQVNEQTNEYESYWDRSGWSRFPVLEDNGTYFWVEHDGTAQAFSVETGNTLVR